MLLFSVAAAGQVQSAITAARPQFDVVSVKLNNGTPGRSTPGNFPVNGTWERRAIFLQSLVALAYNVQYQRVAGVPASFVGQGAPRFDIIAKTSASVNDVQFRLMLQSMLALRFHLAMHWENRDTDVNLLTVAKGGPKLRAASGNCLKVPLSATLPDGQHRCGVVTHAFVTPKGSSVNGRIYDEYVGFSVTMGELAAAFMRNVPVVDETGLTGTYDIKLDIPMTFVQADALTPEEQQEHIGDLYHATDEAFRKELGLSLDPDSVKKRKLPTVVIDHVEMPTPD